LLAERGDSPEDPIPIAIETSRGHLVTCLQASGRRVYAINPMAVARTSKARSACEVTVVRRVALRAALRQVARQWQEKVARGALRPQTADSYITNTERLLRFALALGLDRLDDVTDTVAQAFIDAPGHDRHGRLITSPADSTRRVRRSSVDAFFAEARRLGLTTRAPLLDLPPIPRSQPRPTGILTDTDIDQLRFYAERGMPQTRHAAVLGLLLSGLHTGESGLTGVTDLDLDHERVWAVGAARITARYCPLDDPWNREVLRLRAACHIAGPVVRRW
jgi:hypothetical protein